MISVSTSWVLWVFSVTIEVTWPEVTEQTLLVVGCCCGGSFFNFSGLSVSIYLPFEALPDHWLISCSLYHTRCDVLCVWTLHPSRALKRSWSWGSREGRWVAAWGNWCIKEGAWWDVHWVLCTIDELLNATSKTNDVLFVDPLNLN